MSRREHSMFYEGHQVIDEPSTTQRGLSEKAVDVYAVRNHNISTPGESRTSPTMASTFMSADPLYAEVFPSLVAPLPNAYDNPQDAVHRTHHPAASNGGYTRKSMDQANKQVRIAGAGGTNAQQVFQRQAHLNPVSHPMAGGAQPHRINMKAVFDEGNLPYFPLSHGQAVDDARAGKVTPKSNKAFRDTNLRRVLNRRGA
jgi:hypothetical protein